jgi:hypothetical protein
MPIEIKFSRHKVEKEWDAFCNSLIEGTRVYDSGKALPDDQIPPAEYSEELDLYLRLTFEPPSDGMPPDIFAETPPVLGRILCGRVEEASQILKQVLDSRRGLLVPLQNP